MSEVSKLLSRLLASDVKADLLTLFHRNPGLMDTMEGTARRIGRRPTAVEADMNDLVELGVLKRKRIGRSEVFLLDRTRDSQIQETIADYVRNLKEGRS